MGEWGALTWLTLVEHELLLFAAIFFLIGALDEMAVDGLWVWLRLTGKAKTLRLSRTGVASRPLAGRAAILIPAWQEERVIGHTIAHIVRAWPVADFRLYVGCYRNDPATMDAAIAAAAGDARVRLVVLDRAGPSTKADCLNRLYAAMEHDEQRSGEPFRMTVLHDAEDMVDPAALTLLDRAIDDAEFVQLPVLPLPQQGARWIGGHYCEEFAEAHGKAMVVRSALGASLPAAGVGCAVSRQMLAVLAGQSAHDAPFRLDSLTEDYELGLRIAEAGGRSRFLRVRGDDGQLVATRAFFPARLNQAVRQKARWVHGIAFQGWDRMGWGGGVAECWMRLRDRRGPLSALVLFAGYSVLLIAGLTFSLRQAGLLQPAEVDPLIISLLLLNLASFALRALVRFAFTAREYGWREGVWAVCRIPLANVIAIMAGRRALFAYVVSLLSGQTRWDKTVHENHPASATGSSSVATAVPEGRRGASAGADTLGARPQLGEATA